MQTTICKPIEIAGIGLHSGNPCTVTIQPAPVDNGRAFWIGNKRIQAHYSSVINSSYCTVLGNGSAQVATVEHLLSAAMGMGIDNLNILVNGDEVPILDGSSKPWVIAFKKVGIQQQNKIKNTVAPQIAQQHMQGEQRIEIIPFSRLRIAVAFKNKFNSGEEKRGQWDINSQNYCKELAWARTFGAKEDLPQLLQMNKAKGAGLNNCLVFEKGSLHPSQTLRGKNECLRHKALDLLGDLALLDCPLHAWVKTNQPGHRLTNAALASWNLKPLDSKDKFR